MLGSPKTKFQGKLYGLHSLLSRSKKHVFFLFAYKAMPTMPTTNRNTEVSRVVSGDSQQKHILRIIDARTRP